MQSIEHHNDPETCSVPALPDSTIIRKGLQVHPFLRLLPTATPGYLAGYIFEHPLHCDTFYLLHHTSRGVYIWTKYVGNYVCIVPVWLKKGFLLLLTFLLHRISRMICTILLYWSRVSRIFKYFRILLCEYVIIKYECWFSWLRIYL